MRFHGGAESHFGIGIIGASLPRFEDDFTSPILFDGAEDNGSFTSTDALPDIELVRELPGDEIREHILTLDGHGGVEPVAADFAGAGVG
jgi:hypothetical protein